MDFDFETDAPGRWPLTHRGLMAQERWGWYQRLWEDAYRLRERYRLPIRSQWWTSEIAVEAIAALAAWVERYDSGEWDDPPGKLSRCMRSTGSPGCCATAQTNFILTATHVRFSPSAPTPAAGRRLTGHKAQSTRQGHRGGGGHSEATRGPVVLGQA